MAKGNLTCLNPRLSCLHLSLLNSNMFILGHASNSSRSCSVLIPSSTVLWNCPSVCVSEPTLLQFLFVASPLNCWEMLWANSMESCEHTRGHSPRKSCAVHIFVLWNVWCIYKAHKVLRLQSSAKAGREHFILKWKGFLPKTWVEVLSWCDRDAPRRCRTQGLRQWHHWRSGRNMSGMVLHTLGKDSHTTPPAHPQAYVSRKYIFLRVEE